MPIKTEIVVVDKQTINHDCYIFTLKFVSEPIQFSIGQHFRIIETIKTMANPDGEEVMRKYTPISPCQQIDRIDVLVKIYRPNVHPKFPNGGKMTPFLESRSIGDQIHIEGPFGRFGYKPQGIVIIDGQQSKVQKLFFMAGGSGITPIFQTIDEIARMKGQTVQIILLFANKTEEDIVLRKELEALVPRVQLHYILDQPSEQWTGLKGYVTQELLMSICPLDEPNTLYVHCGPKPMNELIRGIFEQEFPQSKLFKF